MAIEPGGRASSIDAGEAPALGRFLAACPWPAWAWSDVDGDSLVNDAWRVLVGDDARPSRWVGAIAGEDLHVFAARWRRARDSGEPFWCTLRVWDADRGRFRPHRVEFAPATAVAGWWIGVAFGHLSL